MEVFQKIISKYQVNTVFTNHDFESYAIHRDNGIHQLLSDHGVDFKTFKDHVIFEHKEIIKDDGKPYTVFTPYSKKWKLGLSKDSFKSYPSESLQNSFYKQAENVIPSLNEMGFEYMSCNFPSVIPDENIIKHYSETRDFPAKKGTTQISIHLRFGTISIRRIGRIAHQLNEKYLNELVWRDFYQMILSNFPQISEGKSFKPVYDLIQWRNNEKEFNAWCNGLTGYPIVDAGMRELNETGFMHNRVRMIVASFLCKHLLIDWRWGEAYFAKKLNDFDFASNNGGWQWASGSGCDAAPYFRIFNPYLQTEKFDKDLQYIKKWVPEFQEFSYPKPIVDHDFARKRCLEVYNAAVGTPK
ncbi:MAG: cryptochrome/photolyase family protein, partial [Chitinophagaceae bacterium]